MPSPNELRATLQQSGIALDDLQASQLWRFHELLREHNDDRDLTRITGFEAMVYKHYVDCMLVANLVNLPERLLDIGTGPGFPGVPLKIYKPEVHVILAEHRPKRVEFLEIVCKELNLQKAEIFPHKVIRENFHQPVTGVITRAVESVSKTLLRVADFLAPGGQVIFMKGPNVADELRDFSRHRFLKNAFREIQNIVYELPVLKHGRRLLVYEKLEIPE